MKNRIYLDHAASTPVDRRVFTAMEPYYREKFGNPGSLHAFGQEVIAAVDLARETVARSIGAGFREVVFTGSATEANNLALRGAIRGYRLQTAGYRKSGTHGLQPATRNLQPKIIVSAIEHESVIATARELEREGLAEVTVIPVDREGVVNLKTLASALDERTVLISIMYGNNEIGTVQPIAEIADLIRRYRVQGGMGTNEKRKNVNILNPSGYTLYPIFHTDAVQAFQFLPCDVHELGVDLMTLSAHKLYGPKGIGALYMRGGRLQVAGYRKDREKNPQPATRNLQPVTTGGGQEFGIRSGTENVPAIVGFAEAVRIAEQMRDKEAHRVRALAVHAWARIRAAAPNAKLNGPVISSANRVPHIVNIYFPGRKAEELLTALDLRGIAASAGSACAARSFEPSHIVQALGHDKRRATQSIRFSFGRSTHTADIDRLGAILGKLVK